MRWTTFLLIIALTVCANFGSQGIAQEISFWEEFSLSQDREKTLEKLVPGSREYYFFHCLHAQNGKKLDEVDSLLKRWIKRHGSSKQVRVIQNRQALLKYGEDPKETLDFLKRKLGLDFNHQRQIPQTQKDLPTKLDPKLIDPEKLASKHLKQDSNSVAKFNNDGLYWLVDRPLNTRQRRDLLKRVNDPTYPGLVDLITKDLKGKDAKRFGGLSVHQQLTKAQLEKLASTVPELLSQERYVYEYILRLRPSEDVNLLADSEAKRQHLNDMWAFVKGLNPSFNSLKANVLYRMLELDWWEGKPNRKRFVEYLQLPRSVGYINPRMTKRVQRNMIASLGRNYAEVTRCQPVGNDESLVLKYLHHFLVDARNASEFEGFFEGDYLKRQFATAKILAGKGDRESLASMLSPDQYKSLLDRVDLDFATTNREFFDVEDSVELGLFIKNVDKLIVKVFEINTSNFYRKNNREIDTDISLDGLVANDEQVYEFTDPPLLRRSRKFKFDKLNKRGVYVIDFIGGGKSSRALIRKGRLQLIGKATPVGQRFNVVNEEGALVVDAELAIGGRNYSADKDGNIDVPFSGESGVKNAVVSHNDFSSLESFRPVAESYSFKAAFHVDRESLAQNSEATVVIRPSLSISGGNPIPLSRLDSCKLEISTTSIDGVSSSRTISDFAVTEGSEATASFLVPPRLRTVSFRLEGELTTLQNSKKRLVAKDSFTINEIDSTSEIVDLHLLPTNSGWFMEVLGKTGERRKDYPVRFQFNVSGLQHPVSVDLKSDEEGRIELGSLRNVDKVEATAAGGNRKRTWNPNLQQMHLASSYHLLAGETLFLPLPAGGLQLDPSWATLLEKRSKRNVRDCFEKLSIDEQQLVVTKLEPGDYELQLRSDLLDTGRIRIRVTDGTQAGETLVGKHRLLQRHTPLQPFAIAGAVGKEKLTVQIVDATETTRVHVFPVRYMNAFDPFQDLKSIRRPGPWQLEPAIRQSAYIAGRKIGEEYQYILDRRYTTRFPGNMLERPSLLMNPWSVQETENSSQNAAAGDPESDSGVQRSKVATSDKTKKEGGANHRSYSNLDFLGGGHDAILNIKPDKDGQIQLTAKQIGGAQAFRIVVVDLFSVSQTQVLSKPRKLKIVDQRLVNALDPEKHYRQARNIDLLEKGDTLIIEDILSAQYQQYDELADVYALFQGLGSDSAKLRKFRFVLDWLKKTPEEKRSLYSKHACHELNFFIYQKDEKFFDEVVRKHILNKRERTFLDQWLLEEDLGAWLEPWRFSQLNLVEKILLSQRFEDRRADLARHVSELYDLTPTSRDRYDHLFRYSLESRWEANESLARKRDELSRLKSKGGGFISGGALYGADDDVDGIAVEEERKLAEFAVPPSVAFVAPQSMQRGRAMSMGRNSSLGIAIQQQGQQGGQLRGQKGYAGKKLLGGIRKQTVPGSTKMRSETRSRMVPVQRTRQETREVTLADGTKVTKTVTVPYTENVTQSYSVQVPYTENGAPSFFVPADAYGKGMALYRRVEPTREWIENNYFELLPKQQDANLVKVNQFWRDYANHPGGSFASQWFAEANRNFTEMMFALAVLDLPLRDVEEKVEIADGKMTITAEDTMIVLHQQNRESEFDRRGTTVFVSENFFQSNDRYRYEDGVQYDKFVEGDFLANVLYGAEVVITNPTSTPMAIELLIQIPQGALPVSGSRRTRSISMQLNAFSTQKVEYAFYFPAAGEFTHYPGHVSSDVKVLAVAEGRDFNVIDEPESVDKSSWAWVSQNGTDEQVIDFLNEENIQRLSMPSIAFRMKDKEFFARATETLRNRCKYDHTLWSYAVAHNDPDAIREYLDHELRVTSECGMALDCELLKFDPFDRNWYEQREFSPLINARAHQLGSKRKILNGRIYQQYDKLMQILGHKSELGSDDRLVVTYYLLLQDRIEDAMNHFAKIDSENVEQTMPYAYCDAYLDLYREKPDDAKSKAQKWVDYPVDRWREKFESIVTMVDEIKGEAASVVKKEDRTQVQDDLASKAPGFEFRVQASGEKAGSGKGIVEWRNLSELTINYYEMDIEFLFSTNPFASDEVDGFSMIRPNHSEEVSMKEGEASGKHEFNLPEQFDNKNVLVEVVAGDGSKSATWYANSMEVQVIESYGQLLLTNSDGDSPVSKAYVKVFAKGVNGEVEFHKDGYTDLRGRFDYVSQSNRSIDGISEYAILVISDEHGAVVRDAKPPRE